jgi:hypothetical protein
MKKSTQLPYYFSLRLALHKFSGYYDLPQEQIIL